MIRLVDPQRLNRDPFRLAIALLAKTVPGRIGIRRNRTRPRCACDLAEVRRDKGGWCRCEHPALGGDSDADEPEIIAECLHGFQRWTDLTSMTCIFGRRRTGCER